ncbi:ABC transporter substrate-binding protein [Paenibacillus antri]|uniref:ABC transporter substrate-binding protein n=1 Tax=Paenibacillus antri TaxID=2582848 RepID=UPI00130519E8|nr:extracellular solute-binding protein [Paenibacillus antri]
MKKWLTGVASSILALGVLAGCGGGTEPAGGNGGSDSGNSNEKVEISFLYQMDDKRTQPYWDELIADFESKNPNIKIKGMSYPDVAKKGDYIKTLYATGQLPDVTLAGLEDIKLIDGVFMEVPENIVSLFDENALSKRDGKVYTLPTAKYIMLDMFYNTEIFKKYNLTPPKTWAEFLALCQTLKDNGMNPMVEAGQGVSGYILHNPMMTVMLNEIANDYPQKLVSGELKFNGPEIAEIATRFQELWNKGYYQEGSLSFTAPQKEEAFMKGSAAMVVDGQFNAAKYAEGSNFEVGWFPLPAVNSADTYPVMYGDDVGVSAESKHPEADWKLVEYLFSSDVYRSLIAPMSATHTTKEAITYEQNYLSTSMNEISSQLKPLTSFMKIESFPSGTTEAFRSTAQEIAYGADVQKSLDQLENKFRQLLE